MERKRKRLRKRVNKALVRIDLSREAGGELEKVASDEEIDIDDLAEAIIETVLDDGDLLSEIIEENFEEEEEEED